MTTHRELRVTSRVGQHGKRSSLGKLLLSAAGFSLLAAGVWLWYLDQFGAAVSAQTAPEATNPAQEYLRFGKVFFSQKRYADAAAALESARTAPGELTKQEQRELEQLLTEARIRSGRAAGHGASAEASAAKPTADSEDARAKARRLMREARRHMERNEFAEARKKLLEASRLNVSYSIWDERPEHLLAELERRSQAAGSGLETAAGAAEPAPQLRLASSETAAAATSGTEPSSTSGGSADASAEVPLTDRELAKRLLKEARTWLERGDYDAARAKALEALQLDVTYGLFDERPEHILAEIERKTGTETIVPTPSRTAPVARAEDASATKPSSRTSETPVRSKNREQALKLLAEAREDIQAGRLESAREKARQAAALDVVYGLFDDRPELVLADIERLVRNGALARRETTEPASPSEPASGRPVEPVASTGADKARADALLKQARIDLQEGRIESARQKALEAQKIDVVYGLFDDRPELVLADIARLTRESAPLARTTPSIPTPDSPARSVADTSTTDGEQPHRTAERNPFVEPPARVAEAGSSDSPTAMRPGTADSAKAAADRARALELLKQARDDLDAGRFAEARNKALAARELNVAYGVFDDRPEHVLADLDRKLRGSAGGAGSPVIASPREPRTDQPSSVADTGTSEPPIPPLTPGGEDGSIRTASHEPASLPLDQPREIRPDGISALDWYNEGLAHLRQGEREQAYQAFLKAYQSGQRLDPYRTQQLQDYLRALAPRRDGSIRLAGGTQGPPTTAPTPGRLDTAAEQESIRFDRARTEVLNAIFRAERLRESDPERALEVIDRALASVQKSGLAEERLTPLVGSLQKARSSIETSMKQREPLVELRRRNEEVEEAIRREREYAIRVEQELAALVDEYNQLFREQRYAEAEVIGKQAMELKPDSPVAVNMFWKARIARRNKSNEDLRLAKEEGFWAALDEVEWSAVPFHGEPIQFPELREWKELTERRKKYGRPDNRERTPEELRIEESLSRPISLHFDNAPLGDVMKHIATTVGINIVLDQLGLEEEGVTSNTPVTIDVDGIMVKSALNLILKEKNLGYLIQDEVLKITSALRQQGELIVNTYPVADLVSPIPNFIGGGASAMMGADWPTSVSGANYSLPATGGLQQPAGHFQVADPMGAQPAAAPPAGFDPLTAGGVGNPGWNVRLGGGPAAVDFDALTDLIISTVDPTSWDEFGGPGTISTFDTTLSLVIRQTQQVHEEIADLLEQLRRLMDLQVTVEVRFITVSDQFFERIGIDFDFNVNDNVGGPTVNEDGEPLPPFGAVDPDAEEPEQDALFQEPPLRNLINRDDWPKHTTIVGLADPQNFTQDLDIPFRQGSFDIGVPDFGNFQPTAGIQMGLAILSDIEAFFFIQAAQGDQRANLMFAPKVTLFNGQTATVSSNVQRPFVTSLVPTVGFFSVGFTPVITTIPSGIFLTVTAVISADRRFVRLTVLPFFTNVTDVFTFSFVQGAGQAGQLGGIGGGGFGGGFQGFGGVGGFGGGGFNPLFGFGGVGGGNQGQQGQGGLSITVQQPVVEVVNVNTTVSVPDGGTVLLGGVKRLREGRNMAGVPILNKLPYISRLFKNTGVGRETESVMLMVTPRIIIQEEEEELLGIEL